MLRSAYFVQECSTCGRRLEVRVELLGRRVECPHCHSQFVAQQLARPSQAANLEDSAWAARADALLSMPPASRAAS
ncbi:MAG: hypothetical protein U0939_12990 [Pirellulales bacterium]